MIKAQHQYIANWFFNYFTHYQLKRHFSCVNYIGVCPQLTGPVLMLSNHFSWWDGFIQLNMNNKYWRKQFFVMMLEEQLKRYPILAKLGAFSVNKNGNHSLASVRYALKLLGNKDHLLLIFPQGEIQTMHLNEFSFEKGVSYILNKIPDSVNILFNVNLIDYGNKKKPGLYSYLRMFDARYLLDLGVDTIFTQFYNHCCDNQKKLIKHSLLTENK